MLKLILYFKHSETKWGYHKKVGQREYKKVAKTRVS